MKIGALLLAASMLAGCATTPTLNGAAMDGQAMNAGQPRTDAQGATGKVKVDKCMWIKPRCRSR